jgi:hypothetical protein
MPTVVPLSLKFIPGRDGGLTDGRLGDALSVTSRINVTLETPISSADLSFLSHQCQGRSVPAWPTVVHAAVAHIHAIAMA